MAFQKSAESLRSKAHLSKVNPAVVMGLAVVVLTGIFFVLQNVWNLMQYDRFEIVKHDVTPQETSRAPEGEAASAEGESAKKKMICVHVTGAVLHPGVYEVEEGSRIVAVIEAAGGLTEHAVSDALNMARVVTDGEQVVVPTPETAESNALPAISAEKNKKVNINRADVTELMSLSGIGEVTAKKIISDRETQGSFKAIEDIMRVSGIGEKKFEQIKDFISVG